MDALVLLSDPKSRATLSASSVLQKNTKLYGPMNALDVDNGSSSWNSEGNTNGDTSLVLQFGRTVTPVTLKLQFQAGFAAELCRICSYNKDGTALVTDEFELQDVHEVQTFDLSPNLHEAITAIKFVWSDFCDFYGRVILYRLEVWGRETSAEP